MAKKTNPALIGGFVVGAVALAVAAVLIWGSQALFERKHAYICYFPGSVSGLNEGAPVKYRGVEVGIVKEIKIRFRQAPEDKRIPVLIELWGKRLHELGGSEPSPEIVQDLVAGGLRARLASLSLVTGVAYVSFDEVPGSPLTFSEVSGPGALPEIPTLPTELDEVTTAVSGLLANLSTADFKGMSDSVAQAMQGVNQVATSGDLHAAIKHLPRLLSSVRQLTSALNTDADKAGAFVDDAQGALAALHETLQSAQGVVSPQAPLSVDLGVALSDVDKAAIAVRELADFLRRNPHAIVAGTKPRGAGQ
jgi:paraquat-inducible protein B